MFLAFYFYFFLKVKLIGYNLFLDKAMVWASCEVQDSVVQTAVREKWELSVIPWYYHFLFSPYLCLSLPQGHLLLTAILPYYKCCCLSAELLGCSLSLHLSLMFALLPLPLISHRSCLLLSTPKPFIRLSALTYQSLFPVLSYPIPLCPWHSFLLLSSQYFTLDP